MPKINKGSRSEKGAAINLKKKKDLRLDLIFSNRTKNKTIANFID